jgi:hypothetical protein
MDIQEARALLGVDDRTSAWTVQRRYLAKIQRCRRQSAGRGGSASANTAREVNAIEEAYQVLRRSSLATQVLPRATEGCRPEGEGTVSVGIARRAVAFAFGFAGGVFVAGLMAPWPYAIGAGLVGGVISLGLQDRLWTVVDRAPWWLGGLLDSLWR